MRVEEDMVKASKPAEGLKIGDKVTGTIYNILPEGFFLLPTNALLLSCIAVKCPVADLISARRLPAV